MRTRMEKAAAKTAAKNRERRICSSSRVGGTVLAGRGLPSCSRSARRGISKQQPEGMKEEVYYNGKGEEEYRFERLYMWQRRP
jgi:hypothetical protein